MYKGKTASEYKQKGTQTTAVHIDVLYLKPREPSNGTYVSLYIRPVSGTQLTSRDQ